MVLHKCPTTWSLNRSWPALTHQKSATVVWFLGDAANVRISDLSTWGPTLYRSIFGGRRHVQWPCEAAIRAPRWGKNLRFHVGSPSGGTGSRNRYVMICAWITSTLHPVLPTCQCPTHRFTMVHFWPRPGNSCAGGIFARCCWQVSSSILSQLWSTDGFHWKGCDLTAGWRSHVMPHFGPWIWRYLKHVHCHWNVCSILDSKRSTFSIFFPSHIPPRNGWWNMLQKTSPIWGKNQPALPVKTFRLKFESPRCLMKKNVSYNSITVI